MRASVRRLGAALLLGLAACAGRKTTGAAPAPADFSVTSLVVDNQNPAFFEIYVQSSTGLRVRLGTAAGSRMTEFRIPDDLIANGANVRFLALPIASQTTPQTQDLVLQRGDRLSIRILPR